MLAPVISDHGPAPQVERLEDALAFSHAGGNAGFRCFMVGYCSLDQGPWVTTNGDYGDVLMMEVIRGMAQVLDWPNLHPAEAFDFIENADDSMNTLMIVSRWRMERI
jgi:hypothetical protein